MGENDIDLTVQEMVFSFPTPEHPYYHLNASFAIGTSKEYKVERVLFNGKRVRDFLVYNNGRRAARKTIQGQGKSALVARADWGNGSTNRLEIRAVATDEGSELHLVGTAPAPPYGGYWDPAWKHYTSAVFTESAGVRRSREPVHLTLGLYADRLTDPLKEIRVVAVDQETGRHTEVPSQVYEVSTWSKQADIHCQPTTTCKVAFFVDVPVRSSSLYLVFYGNPSAERPTYASDLRVEGKGLGLKVENSYYRATLHAKSGAIDEFFLKMGVNEKFDHHLETNGALHWNPCVYAPPRTWIHASDWDTPPGYAKEEGPIFFMTKRWGALPHYPEVEVSVTYLFYAYTPYVMVTTVTDVLEDITVQALRNGEIVLNHNLVREFAWKKPTGEVESVVYKELPRHPTRALEMPSNTPWLALYNRECKAAFGAINLEQSNMRRGGGLVCLEQPYMYLNWGPWVYWCRALVYTFMSSNPQRMIPVPGGSTYYEKMAYMPFRLGESDKDRFDLIEKYHQILSNPLHVKVEMDTDERVPEEWTPPILVEEFEEMED